MEPFEDLQVELFNLDETPPEYTAEMRKTCCTRIESSRDGEKVPERDAPGLSAGGQITDLFVALEVV